MNEEAIRRQADPRSFERGRAYLAAGKVRKLTIEGGTARAIVDGAQPYRVLLAMTPSGLTGECTCPYGSEGMFCKHCVAAALAWPEPETADDDHLLAFLTDQDPAWLATELLRASETDPLLRARLERAAGG